MVNGSPVASFWSRNRARCPPPHALDPIWHHDRCDPILIIVFNREHLKGNCAGRLNKTQGRRDAYNHILYLCVGFFMVFTVESAACPYTDESSLMQLHVRISIKFSLWL